ncbi:hypothetical protein [Roseicella frigidaeris]|uniref:Uncharacterized protein n=1 Tax=Roseicella frigidaeris TaxID=2230885 RepID=A0A327M7S4_9PROT|nr:hypothetical protein [Roseicella frigidaeris]RAI58990.1 hypothetical protein DOO78_10620 [Roseicella frigidaeris]
MRRGFLGLLGGLAVQAPAMGQSLAEAAAALPAEIAGWQRGAVLDFDARFAGAGLGAAIEYRPLAGGAGVATVYLYDRGRGDPPVDEIRQAVDEVAALGPIRHFALAGRGRESLVAGPEGGPGLRCEALLLAFETGQRADSYVCLGRVGEHRLKLRMTLPAAAPGWSDGMLASFGRTLLAATRTAAPPVAKPGAAR